ncbi:MAG: flagellar protein FlgN [Syntrophus sp. (in: bacteria)]|nr:flagellar protein FlgN [Syntrophus sp. (in: bacteria)]
MNNARKTAPFAEQAANAINTPVQSLIKNLHDETNVYGELVQLIEREQEILRHPSLDDLLTNHSRMEACLLNVQICRNEKEKILKAFQKTAYTGCDDERTLYSITEHADDHLKNQLLECQDKHRRLIETIKNLTSRNVTLLRGSLSQIGSTLMFLQKTISCSMNYMPSGRMCMTMPNGTLFDRRG